MKDNFPVFWPGANIPKSLYVDGKCWKFQKPPRPVLLAQIESDSQKK